MWLPMAIEARIASERSGCRCPSPRLAKTWSSVVNGEAPAQVSPSPPMWLVRSVIGSEKLAM
ncbi:MAG: hypothetical protein WDM85_05530 [Caulobacteraceae bacterium]